MAGERLLILNLPEDKNILSNSLLDIDYLKLLESSGIILSQLEDVSSGSHVVYTELLFDGKERMLPLSITTKTRGPYKPPSTTIFVPKGFEDLDPIQQDLSLAYLFLNHREPINLNFESGTDNQTVAEAYKYITTVRDNFGIILSNYSSIFAKIPNTELAEVI